MLLLGLGDIEFMFVEVLALLQIQKLNSYLIYIYSQSYLERENKSGDWIFFIKDLYTS